MNRWTSIIFFVALLVGGCDYQDTTLNGVHFFTFHAAWCGPCKLQEPIVEQLEKDFATVTFHHVNIDEQRELTRKYNVTSIPCMVITVDGKEVTRFVGVSSYRDLSAELSKHDGTANASSG